MKAIFMVLVTFCLLTGCTYSALKAPCDEHATFCGSKTKINV